MEIKKKFTIEKDNILSSCCSSEYDYHLGVCWNCLEQSNYYFEEDDSGDEYYEDKLYT